MSHWLLNPVLQAIHCCALSKPTTASQPNASSSNPLSIQSLSQFGTTLVALTKIVALPLSGNSSRCASTHFGEIQLAPNSIEISPLTTTHPLFFQQQSVGTSTQLYLSFILVMVRSSGFGSVYHDLNALFGLVFTLTPVFSCLNRGPGYTSRQRILQQVRGRTVFTLPLLVNLRFQGLFHSPSGVLFTFPSRYLFTIGCFGILSLTRWSSQIQRDYACPPYSGYNFKMALVLDYRTFTFYGAIFQLLHLTSCIF